MKKLVFIFLCYLITPKFYAQAFKVGDVNCNYKMANYTFTANCPQYTFDDDYYILDVDGDLAPDLSMRSSCKWLYFSSLPGWINAKEIYFTPSYTNCQLVWDGMGGIKAVPFGTVMNNSLTWGNTGGYMNGSYSSSYYVCFRKMLINDTINCWISIDFSSFPGKVNSYAFKRTSDNLSPQPATITASPTSICKGDSLTLTATPGGGNFYGTGVSNNYFNSKNLSAGVYTVMYVIPGSTCTTIPSTVSITVNALPTLSFTPNNYYRCESDTLSIGALPSGGTFSYSAAGFSVNTIYCAQSGIGTHTLTYTYTDGNGCTKSQPVNIVITSCVGIDELVNSASQMQIFPNPSNGEFEIKGIKEETIFVTNELGQLVSLIKLAQENNYLVKLNNLQSGVYIIGNNSVRQKIVVIK